MNRNIANLQHDFYKLFMTHPQKIFSVKHLNEVCKDIYSIQEIFSARYQSDFIGNIRNQQVFMKVLTQLQNIVAIKQKIKFTSKTKDMTIMKKNIFLDKYFDLLFTEEQKKIITEMINKNYGISCEKDVEMNNFEEEQEQRGDQKGKDGIETIKYMLKNILKIQDEEKPEPMLQNNPKERPQIYFDDL